MRILVFYALVAGWLVWVFAVDRYSAWGIQIARSECDSKGILRVRDHHRWQDLVSKPATRTQYNTTVHDYRTDSRFLRTVHTLSFKNEPVAELHILRAYPISSLSWTGLITPSPAFICAADVRSDQYQRLLPLFT